MADPVEVMAKAITSSRHRSGPEWADNVIAALDAAGFAVVPKEPTDEMLQAFEDEYVCMFGAAPPSPWSKGEALYLAMLSAAQVKP